MTLVLELLRYIKHLWERKFPSLSFLSSSPRVKMFFLFLSLFFIFFLFGIKKEPPMPMDSYLLIRQEMVNSQLKARDIRDPKVLKALSEVPRHLFVPKEIAYLAYEDTALPIGYAQTISQPYMVAIMTQEAHISPHDRVLEIGTGSGYQAAILSLLAKEVYTIEVITPLGEKAWETLTSLGYKNIKGRIDDGHKGWPESAPFDAILVTATASSVPETLISQLKEGGRLLLPLKEQGDEQLTRIIKTKEGFHQESLFPVRFVPFVHKDPPPPL
jgi:protein-L-isoaspartate(D-aspartate) O-methyltransferase